MIDTSPCHTLLYMYIHVQCIIEVSMVCMTSFHSSGMSTEKNKELFLRQVQDILKGIQQDRERVSCVMCEGVRVCGDDVPCVMVQLERRRADEKVEKDRLNGMYLELVEKQRAYYKTVRDFQEVLHNYSAVIETLVPCWFLAGMSEE